LNSHSPSQAHRSAGLHCFSIGRRSILTRLFRRRVVRRVGCLALIASLLILPGPGIGIREVAALASTAVDLTNSPIRYLQPILRSLLGLGVRARPRRETLADRIAQVSQVRISPLRLVGYTGEGAAFTAVGADLFDRTIPGLKFTWEPSDPDKLQIDEAGRATFLQPGLVRVICRAGTAVATAPVLIRLNHRPVQSDQEWRNDQNGLDASGNIVGELSGGESTAASAKYLLNSLVDKLAPTAYAQGGSGDLVECNDEIASPVRAVLRGRPFSRRALCAPRGAATEDRPYRFASEVFVTSH